MPVESTNFEGTYIGAFKVGTLAHTTVFLQAEEWVIIKLYEKVLYIKY